MTSGWLDALGVDVELRIDDEDLAAPLLAALDDLRVPEPTLPGPTATVTVEGSRPWRVTSPAHTGAGETPAQAVMQALTAVNLSAVALTPRLAFHTAVLARDGATLVVPGRSGLGKSTLTACLLREGWDYVSDEALSLTWDDGGVRAYPRPLALSPWSCAAVGATGGLPSDGETVLRARDLGAAVQHRPEPVTHVVLLERSDDAPGPRLEAVHRTDALEELMRRGFTHHRDGGRALVLVAELLRGSEVVRLTLGEPRASARHLHQAVGA